MRILLVRLSAFGDLLQTLPIQHALRTAVPEAEISLLVRGPHRKVAEKSAFIDRVISYEMPPPWPMPGDVRHHWEVARARRAVRDLEVDLVIDIHGLRVASRAAASVKAKKLVSVGKHRSILKKGGVALKMESSSSKYVAGMAALRAAGIDAHLDTNFRLEPPQVGIENLASTLPAEPYVTVHVGASNPNKIWDPALFGAVASRLRRDGYSIVLVGSNIDARYTPRFLTECEPDVDLVGETGYDELCAAIAQARLHFGNDSAPSHVAAIHGTPCVSVYSFADPLVFEPWNQPDAVIDARKREITVDEVYEKCLYKLSLPR